MQAKSKENFNQIPGKLYENAQIIPELCNRKNRLNAKSSSSQSLQRPRSSRPSSSRLEAQQSPNILRGTDSNRYLSFESPTAHRTDGFGPPMKQGLVGFRI